MKLLVVHELRKRGSSWKKLLTENFAQEEVSKSVEENVTGECSKESGRKKGGSKNKRKKPSNEVDIVGPSSPKSVSKLDKGKTIVLEEPPASRVKRSSKTKKPCPDLSTKRKT
jgi:hypothetical protein